VTKPSYLLAFNNLTIFSPLIMSSYSSFCRILHNSGQLARWRRSHLLFYDNDVIVVVIVIIVVVVEFYSLFLFGNYFRTNPGLSWW
jgi:hypothetical protein